MSRKAKILGKGEEDLIKNSSVMADIDDLANEDNTINLVGGSAYDSNGVDKLTTAKLLNIQKSGEKQSEGNFSIFLFCGLKDLLIIILTVVLLAIIVFVILQLTN